MTGTAALPPIQASAIASSPSTGGGGATETPRSPRVPGAAASGSARFGCGNPLTNCGATIIGLGTVGLGDRSTEERRRATRNQYEAWKRQKEAQEVADRVATGGNTPKKPLTSKEMYQRRRVEAQERLDRRIEHEMELARKSRDDAAQRKSELQMAQAEEKEFTERFRAYILEENKRSMEERSHQRDRSGSPVHETVEEKTNRVQASMSARRSTLQTNAETFSREHLEYVQSLHDSLRNVVDQAQDSRRAAMQQKHAIVESQRKKHSSRRNWLSKTEKERESDLKEIAKTQRTFHQQKLELVMEKQLVHNAKEADQVREQRTPRSKAGDGRQEEERQRQRAEERRRAQAEHEQLIQQQLATRAEEAEMVRKAKAELAKALEDDRKEALERKKRLHDDCIRSRSPTNKAAGGSSATTHGSGSAAVVVPPGAADEE